MGVFEMSNFKFQIRRGLARVRRRLSCLLPTAFCLLLLSASTAYAQNCPYCYANAAAQTPGMLHALKTGVLVIMLPCLAMFIVIFGVAYRRRDSFNAESADAVDAGWEAGPAE